ncbi:MAG TPA: FtsX-like permease family protein [Thermomicrobiales bacterium]|nr:FtsX-like permease family protein [Thermomicrobiales bacterium]
MEKLFGIPMSSIMVVLLALLAICLLSVAFIAWRRPVIFKLGVRNIPRRKAQTALIIVGLMLATLIISAALGTGDTLNRSVTSQAVDIIGPLDEIVVYSNDPEGDASVGNAFIRTIPESSVERVQTAVDGNPNVDAVGGVLFSQAPTLNIGSADPSRATTMSDLIEVAEGSAPSVWLSGLAQDTIDQLGGLSDVDGNAVDVTRLGNGGVYLNENAAEDLNVEVGGRIAFSLNNQLRTGTVQGILPESLLTGAVAPGEPAMLMEIGRLQQISGLEGQISAVGVSNVGDAEAGLELTDEVVETLEAGLAGEPLGTVAIKQDNVEQAELIANIFVTFFIVFGLFSIGVGILLIVLIFTMLAAERRAEMGMERAVGAQRRQLIQQFVAEGAGYTLISGLVGTGLGVLAAFGIVQGFRGLIGDAFDITPYVSPRSLVIAYCLGVVITFIAVALSSWRVSRLNIVAAVRDIPDAYEARRNRRQLVWSVVMIVAGTLLAIWGQSIDLLAPFTIGMTLIPFGIAGILTYFGLNSRLVLTIAGLYTLGFWLLPDSWFRSLFGDLNGDIDMFFVSGICIVAASTLIIVQNLDAILAGAEMIGGRVRGQLPAVRLAVSYPGANKGRTGLTIAMFSLIVFSLVMVAAINANFTEAFLNDEANAGWDIEVTIPKENPVPDFAAALRADGVDTSRITEVGRLEVPDAGATQALSKDGEWRDLSISAANVGYLDNDVLRFQAHATGYESDEAIIEALKTEPGVMVIDSFSAADAEGGFGPPLPQLPGVPSEGTFAPAPVEVQTGDGQTHTVRVIGVIDTTLSMLAGGFVGPPTSEQLFPSTGPRAESYYLKVADGVDPGEVANEVELALLPFGAEGIDLEQQMADDQSSQQSFMYILQGFMGLGMIVGIAAVGVIAFRAVVERRQQIGMLRALGFQRNTVAQAFVIESAIIVILGVLAGAVFGLTLAYQLMTSEDFTEGAPSTSGFIIPWGTMVVTLVGAVIAALLMAWLPARQASRVVPAEALRYE